MPTVIEPISAAPTRPVQFVTQRQDWYNAVFLHWEIDPEIVRGKLPAHTEVDTFDGRTYVGLICLDIRVALLGVLPVPYLGRFPEVNVRLYSVGRDGRRGIVFCSLDADRLVPALAGRAGYGLPYMWSDVWFEESDNELHYSCRRRWPGADHPAMDLTVRKGGPITNPTLLDHFMTARWSLHWSMARLNWRAAAQHEPWPLHSAEVVSVNENLIEAAGLPATDGEPVSVLWSPGVHAKIGPPARL
jgi:uncharacterized protein YqjF (DUF2071 family)